MQKLKYLFTASYKDGTTYVQNAEDRSVTEPEKRSCFFDIDHSKLETFTLTGDGHEYLVDLRDGHFESDGVPFFVYDEWEPVVRKLVFFRQHKHTIEQTKEKDTELSHTITYLLGWEAVNAKGITYQKIIQII